MANWNFGFSTTGVITTVKTLDNGHISLYSTTHANKYLVEQKNSLGTPVYRYAFNADTVEEAQDVLYSHIQRKD